MKRRAIIDIALVLLLIVVFVTGVLLLNAPSGRIAKASDWNVLGLSKEGLESLHWYAGVLFTLVAVLHLAINWKTFKALLLAR